jgi:uncharacterized protein YneF (UPF0154 family)
MGIEMDLTYEIALWALGLVVGFILGWLTNWYFYKKQLKENEVNSLTLKQIRQYIGAQIRVGDDKRGKIVERPDGTIAVNWQVNVSEFLGASASVETKLIKGKESEQ